MSLFDQLLYKAAQDIRHAANDAVNDAAKKIKRAAQTTKVKLSAIPQTAEEMKAMKEFDLKDPYSVAAMTVCALVRYPESSEDCFEMLDLLNGPNELTVREKQFINERFMDDHGYIMRSYFEGATPDNNYTPSSKGYKIAIEEYATSDDTENYLTLYLVSGGADSPRAIQLREKPSTKEWFIWSYDGLLSGVREPKEKDPWA